MRILLGIGIDDRIKVETNCRFYECWSHMIKRCYCKKTQDKQPTYTGCVVSDEWLRFSEFKKWMETQDYLNKELDKDLLINGNKIYSSKTCVFISKRLNCFFNSRKRLRGKYPLGVCWDKKQKAFRSQCRQLDGKQKYLGKFENEEDAHRAWKNEKHRLSCLLASYEVDERIIFALRNKYLGDIC